MKENQMKILVFGGTGYIGNNVVRASIKLGHPTYIYSRPQSNKTQVLNEFKSMGAIIVKGDLNDHDKLVSVLKEVDVVISALACPQVLDQLKIIEAIKLAGNIKRFLPSGFGSEEDRVIGVLKPFEAVLDKRKKIRRAIEAANVPYTFVSANCCGAYFVNYLLRPHDEQREEITVYGDGETKAVFNYEEDIGIFTVKVATDPRTRDRTVIYRPEANIISQLELISLWEKKTGKTFKRVHVAEEQIVALSQTLPDPQNTPVSILHGVFVKGVTVNFDITESEIEASTLYPDLKFITVDQLLDIILQNPPKPASSAVFG